MRQNEFSKGDKNHPFDRHSNPIHHEDFFNKMIPLKDQLKERAKPHISDRERRLILKELEKKKRLAEVNYDNQIPVDIEGYNDNEYDMAPREVQEAVYRGQREKDYEYFRRELTRLQKVNDAGMRINSLDNKAREIEEKRKKQLLYRNLLEEQLKPKTNVDRAADEIFTKVARGITEEKAPINPYLRQAWEEYRQEQHYEPQPDIYYNPPYTDSPTYNVHGQKGTEDKKQKKEEYRKFLEDQMNEKKNRMKQEKNEASVPIQILKCANTLIKEEEAEKQKKLHLQQYMHEELKKQMEEKEKKKKLEKQKQKEEELKEMERLKREQEELERNAQMKGKLPAQQKLKELQPSTENPMARLNQYLTPNNQPINSIKSHSAQNSPVKIEYKHNSSSIPKINRVSAHIKPSSIVQNTPDVTDSLNYENANLIEEYKRRIERLRSENLLAKEEVNIFREQLINERELRLNKMMSQLQQNKTQTTPHIDIQELSASQHKQDDTASIAQLMRSELKYRPPATFDLEESLASETKLVEALGQRDADLYKTWNNVEVKPEKQEISVQTSIGDKGIPEVFKDKIRKRDKRRALENAKKCAQKSESIPEEVEEDKQHKENYIEELELGELDMQSQEIEKSKPVRHDESESGVIIGVSRAETTKQNPIEHKDKKVIANEEIEEDYSEIEGSLLKSDLNPKLEDFTGSVNTLNIKDKEQSIAIHDSSNAEIIDSKPSKSHKAKNAATKIIDTWRKDIEEMSHKKSKTKSPKKKFPIQYEVEDALEDFKIYEEP